MRRLVANFAMLWCAGSCALLIGVDGDYHEVDSTAGGNATTPTTAASGGAGGQAGGTNSGAGGAGGSASAPASCIDIKNADPLAADGDHFIDVDGAGAIGPFVVRCDMTIDGGGWTRFHWLTAPFVVPTDPLGQQLQECDVNDPSCFARIPAGITPGELLVKDIDDGHHAAWSFDGTPLSNVVLAALRDKAEACEYNLSAWQPYIDTSTEPYCGNQLVCDSFIYTQGSCGGYSNWALELDDDGFPCDAAFKMGATYGNGNFGMLCGDEDYGYLNDCDCSDERGELYYR